MSTIKEASDREIVISRVLDAPRERVWAALTDPKQLDAWWGPDGFRNITREIALKPGGIWRHTMIGPDGAEYPNVTKYEEIVKPERVVFTNGGGRKDGPGASFRATWSLKDLGGKTELTIRMVFATPAERDFVVKEFGAIEGGKQTLGRLNEHLTKSGDFTISRLLDAPRDVVYRAWTEPDRMKEWFGPKGMKTAACKLDLRPGGFYHYGLETPAGQVMWGKWIFREIVPNERLVFVSSFSDKDMGYTRHPMSPNWPLEMLSTITFEDKGGKTLLTIAWAAINATEAERKLFESSFESMKGGWGGTLEQLEAYLREAR